MALDTPDAIDFDRLARLVDNRTEDLHIEYKSWMDLSDPQHKSKIAKHLCAIANFGGGWLVFGVENDGRHSEPHAGNLDPYNQDIINGIVSRYLTPTFHCTVHYVKSKLTGYDYPVVQIPSHGAQPICAKVDGPLIDKRRVGVSQGTHYIRTNGPKSIAIDRPDLWRDVLHRCVLAEREQLLSSIGRLFEKPVAVQNAPNLDKFLDVTIDRWREQQGVGWLVDPIENKSSVSFQLLKPDRTPVEPIALNRLVVELQEATAKADAECQFAVGPFDLTYSRMSAPGVIVFDDVEGYESNTVMKDGDYLFAPLLSRVLVNGIGAEVRPYHEDTDWVLGAVNQRSSRKWAVGAYISPTFQAARMYSFVLFVKILSASFSDAARCVFVVDFEGLKGRSLRETRSLPFIHNRISATSQRRVRLDVTLERLAGDGASEIAALLLNPILRLFDGFEVDSKFIRTRPQDI